MHAKRPGNRFLDMPGRALRITAWVVSHLCRLGRQIFLNFLFINATCFALLPVVTFSA